MHLLYHISPIAVYADIPLITLDHFSIILDVPLDHHRPPPSRAFIPYYHYLFIMPLSRIAIYRHDERVC